jgi:hypothetical protein
VQRDMQRLRMDVSALGARVVSGLQHSMQGVQSSSMHAQMLRRPVRGSPRRLARCG